MMEFSDKKAVVTGGTRGIGRSVVELLISLGCEVIYTGTKIAEENPVAGAEYWQLNLLDKKNTDDFLKKLRRLLKLDILINNAGINVVEPIDELRLDNWDKIVQVNLTGVMLIMREAAKLMKKSRTSGKILNISSIFGVVSRAKRNAYSASKTGLIGLTRSVCLDLAPFNILVNAICPGFTKTELTNSMLSEKEQKALCEEIPLGRFAEVIEIAKAIVFLCSNENKYMTGQTLIIDGGFTVR